MFLKILKECEFLLKNLGKYFIRNNISTNLIKQCEFKIKNNLI